MRTVLRCQDCYCEFEFTERQQAHFSQCGWAAPVRCPNCRAAKKQREQIEFSIQELMRNKEKRLYSRHGRGYFSKLRNW